MDDYPELPWSWQVPPGLKAAWLAALRHQSALVIWREGWTRPQLTRGVFHPPSWSGHRDACPTQWGGPCDCDLPPRTTPCTCRYRLHTNETPIPGAGYVKCDDFTAALFYSCWRRWSFDINPRCHHHGDRARTYRRPCTCPGLTHNPDCRRHNYNPAEDEPRHHHDDIHNPNDLDEDERHD